MRWMTLCVVRDIRFAEIMKNVAFPANSHVRFHHDSVPCQSGAKVTESQRNHGAAVTVATRRLE